MQKRCVSCMNYIDENSEKCNYCGHIYEKKGSIGAIAPEVEVYNQYIIKKVMIESNEGYSYLAYDHKNDRKIVLKEFFPKELVHRDSDNLTVLVNPSCEESFGILYKEFEALNSKLTKIGSAASVARCYKVFSLNNTLYSVNQFIEGVSLQKHLVNEFGELNWEETEEMFIPVIYGLNTLNGLGISHLAINTDNLIVENGKTIKISNFCIPQVNVSNNYITPTFVTGFTPKEQQEMDKIITEASDVYAFCAVLYKALTGTLPSRNNLRAMNDEFISPKGLKPNIPQSVSDAIMKGLKPNPSERTQTFKDLMKDLYNQAPIIESEAVESPLKLHDIEQNRKNGLKMPLWLLVLLISLPITLTIFALLYFMVVGPINNKNHNSDDLSSSLVDSSDNLSSSFDDSSPSSSTQSSNISSSELSSSRVDVSGVEVEDFTNKYYDVYANSQAYKQLFTFKPTYEYDEYVEKGLIIKQSVDKGSIVKKGTVIEFVVSKGPRYYTIPQFLDDSGVSVNAEEYAAILKENNIPYKIVEEESDVVEEGQIIRLNLTPGNTIDYENLTMITIYSAIAPIGDEPNPEDPDNF